MARHWNIKSHSIRIDEHIQTLKLSVTSVVLHLRALVIFITTYYFIKMLRNLINVTSAAKPFFPVVLSKVCECFIFNSHSRLRLLYISVHKYYNHEEHPGRFQCTVCGKNFKAKQGLQVWKPLENFIENKSISFGGAVSYGFSFERVEIRVRLLSQTLQRIQDLSSPWNASPRSQRTK